MSEELWIFLLLFCTIVYNASGLVCQIQGLNKVLQNDSIGDYLLYLPKEANSYVAFADYHASKF